MAKIYFLYIQLIINYYLNLAYHMMNADPSMAKIPLLYVKLMQCGHA